MNEMLMVHKVDEKDGGMNWFSSRHNPSIGPSGTILRLCYVCFAFVLSCLSLMESISIHHLELRHPPICTLMLRRTLKSFAQRLIQTSAL